MVEGREEELTSGACAGCSKWVTFEEPYEGITTNLSQDKDKSPSKPGQYLSLLGLYIPLQCNFYLIFSSLSLQQIKNQGRAGSEGYCYTLYRTGLSKICCIFFR